MTSFLKTLLSDCLILNEFCMCTHRCQVFFSEGGRSQVALVWMPPFYPLAYYTSSYYYPVYRIVTRQGFQLHARFMQVLSFPAGSVQVYEHPITVPTM